MIAVDGEAETWYFYHFDGLGSVVALSKLNAGTVEVVERYRYDAFGQTIVCDGHGIPRSSNESDFGNPYMFTGREYDSETGLYYYRARMYSPELGRFCQTDPIGYYDSLNLYTYCGNNPINWNDPYGLCKGSSLNKFQMGLDIIGMFDPFGIADGLNATIYLFRGQYADALMSLAGVVGADVAKLGRLAGGATAAAGLYFIAKYGDEVAAVAKYGDEAADAGTAIVKYDPLFAFKQGANPGTVVPNNYTIVRGGQSAVPATGTFSGSMGSTLEQAAAGVPHGSIRATTAGAIKDAGGTVELAPEIIPSTGTMNMNHVNITGGSNAFGPIIQNPVPKAGRIK